VGALYQTAKEESWPKGQTEEWLKEISAPADHLMEAARGAMLDAAIDDWVEKGRSLAGMTPGCSAAVLEEKSNDYKIEELEY
jgi:hypothetical protein